MERVEGAAVLDSAPPATGPRMIKSAASEIFIGRERELGALGRAFADARHAGVTVTVGGAGGIGKSTLVREFLRAVGDGAQVVEGRCFEREAVPFKLLAAAIESLAALLTALPPDALTPLVPRELGSLVRVFPALRRVPQLSELASQRLTPADPAELRHRAFRALTALLAGLARDRPVVLFLDDAHWGDADSVAVLAELAHAAAPGVLVIIAHRLEDYRGVVAQLRRRAEVRALRVPPLSVDESTTLVARLAGAATAALIGEAIAASAGHPLVLGELARDAVRLGRAGHALTIDEVVRVRTARLTPEAHAMLALSSIAARPIAVAVAAYAAGVTHGLEEATRLATARFATVWSHGTELILCPPHDHVRTAVLATLDTEARAGWHEALARAFEAVQGEDQLDSQAVVDHWLAAGYPATAAHHAVGAALVAEAAFASCRAAELYEVAIAFGPWDAAGQRDLMRRKAQAYACAGMPDDAATVYAHAAHLFDAAESRDLERLRVEDCLRRGRLDDALPAAEALLDQIGLRIPLATPSRTRLVTQWVQLKLRGLDHVERAAAELPASTLLAIDVLYSIASGLAVADPIIGRVVQSEHVKAALDAGEATRVCLALAQEVCYAAAAGTRNRGAIDSVSRRLKALALKHPSPHVRGFADTALGIAAHQCGRWRDARGQLELGLQTLRDHGVGVRAEIDLGAADWLASLFYLGEWTELARSSLALVEEARDRSDAIAALELRIGRCNLAWLVRDQPAEARIQLAVAESTLAPGVHLARVAVVMAQVAVALYAGDAADALARVDAVWPLVERAGFLRLQQPRIELTWLRACALLADETSEPTARLREARALADALVAEGVPWAVGLGHLVRASAYAWSTAPREARLELLAAEDQLADAGMAGHVAVCQLRRGELEGGVAGSDRATAARSELVTLGARNPEAMATLILCWPKIKIV